jgi:hypothetical protein
MGEDGVAAIEAVIVLPIAMLVLLFAVQLCIWAHAATIVDSAAVQGSRDAELAGGSIQMGVGQAQLVLATDAKGVVVSPSVEGSIVTGDRVEVRIRAYAESVLPGIRLPVSSDSSGPIQEFRPDR